MKSAASRKNIESYIAGGVGLAIVVGGYLAGSIMPASARTAPWRLWFVVATFLVLGSSVWLLVKPRYRLAAGLFAWVLVLWLAVAYKAIGAVASTGGWGTQMALGFTGWPLMLLDVIGLVFALRAYQNTVKEGRQ
jgi:hypothetical protein